MRDNRTYQLLKIKLEIDRIAPQIDIFTFRLTEAKRSRFGVIANESPYAPNAGRKSSTTINNTFGATYQSSSGIT